MPCRARSRRLPMGRNRPRQRTKIMRPDRTEPAVTAADASLLHEGAALFTTNLFEERWLAIQKRLLGPAYQEAGRVLPLGGDLAPLPNLARAMELLRPMHAGIRARLEAHAPATPEELADVRDAA